MTEENKTPSPAEFYRSIRPEYFSDSEVISDPTLTEEVFAFQLSRIAANEKQNEFENFCRKLAEKCICPNLIPNSGSAGGGDGKTDFETHPVSNDISDRWFVPANGWDNNQKWAFAISAKEDWSSKVRSDVKKISETKREYTHIHFFSSRLIASKDRKKREAELLEEFGLKVTIYDETYLVEKVFNNNLINLAVDTLNLSTEYRQKEKLGSRDTARIEKLNELEENIQNPDRYSKGDFQLVEDCLDAAILSRMLEKPRDEVEGKFDRAIRFSNESSNRTQLLRIHYQRAWTYANFYNDFDKFIESFGLFKKSLNTPYIISEIEFYINLINILIPFIKSVDSNVNTDQVDMEKEEAKLDEILTELADDDSLTTSSLIAKTYQAKRAMMASLASEDEQAFESSINSLNECISKGSKLLEYPFEVFADTVERLGEYFPDSGAYDNLIDTIAQISSQRIGELRAGETYIRRGGQKLEAGLYKEGAICFGRSIFKLAKEESPDGMRLALWGLATSYRNLGMLWASNSCLVAATAISLKTLKETGVPSIKSYRCVKELVQNEAMIGRTPSFLMWYQVLGTFHGLLSLNGEDEHALGDDRFLDSMLANRLLHSNEELLPHLSDIFNKNNLFFSADAALYKLGYTADIIESSGGAIKDEEDLDNFYEALADQPITKQFLYETNNMDSSTIQLKSRILGSEFCIIFEKDKELLLKAEAILAFLESFFATSLSQIAPKQETVIIKLSKTSSIDSFKFEYNDEKYEYLVEINNFRSIEELEEKDPVILFITHVLANNFIVSDPEQYLDQIFKNEEVNERLSLIFSHEVFMNNILGSANKTFFEDWFNPTSMNTYNMTRKDPVEFKITDDEPIHVEPADLEQVGHNERKVLSIIDIPIWDKAGWSATFYAFQPPHFVGLGLAFKDFDYGKAIFDKWIKRVGKVDSDELIRVAIIKNTNPKNPNWYKVHVSANLEKQKFNKGALVMSASRINEMTPDSSTNLDNFMDAYGQLGAYAIFPAHYDESTGSMTPDFERCIQKKDIIIKDISDISDRDLDSVVIRSN